jgi:hypothetical protein
MVSEELRIEDLAESLKRLEAVILKIAFLTKRLEIKLQQGQPGCKRETKHA